MHKRVDMHANNSFEKKKKHKNPPEYVSTFSKMSLH